jgi:2-polyprenyl-6-methoxyphenol hydroxylase-like FAD-dependent oxidoreductase
LADAYGTSDIKKKMSIEKLELTKSPRQERYIDEAWVTLKGQTRPVQYDLVIGADGTYSSVHHSLIMMW